MSFFLHVLAQWIFSNMAKIVWRRRKIYRDFDMAKNRLAYWHGEKYIEILTWRKIYIHIDMAKNMLRFWHGEKLQQSRNPFQSEEFDSGFIKQANKVNIQHFFYTYLFHFLIESYCVELFLLMQDGLTIKNCTITKVCRKIHILTFWFQKMTRAQLWQ